MPGCEMVAESTAEALESMCFTSILEALAEDHPARPAVDGSWICTSLEFRGDVHGTCAMAASGDAARSVAANFLGLDTEELTTQEADEVVGELTNMVAGSLVSRLESGVSFELSHPRASAADEFLKEFPGADAHMFALEEGYLAVWLRLGEGH